MYARSRGFHGASRRNNASEHRFFHPSISLTKAPPQGKGGVR